MIALAGKRPLFKRKNPPRFTSILLIMVSLFEVFAVFDLWSRYLSFDLTAFFWATDSKYESFDVVACIMDAVRDALSDEAISKIRSYCWAHGIHKEDYYESTLNGRAIYLRKKAQNVSLVESLDEYIITASREREESCLYKSALYHVSILLLLQAVYLASYRCAQRSKRRLSKYLISVNLMLQTLIICSIKIVVFGQYTQPSQLIQTGYLLDLPDLSVESQYLSNRSPLFRELTARRPIARYVKMKDDLRTNAAVWQGLWPVMFACQILFTVFSCILIVVASAFGGRHQPNKSSDELSPDDSKSRFIQNPGYEFHRTIEETVQSDAQKDGALMVNV